MDEIYVRGIPRHIIRYKYVLGLGNKKAAVFAQIRSSYSLVFIDDNIGVRLVSKMHQGEMYLNPVLHVPIILSSFSFLLQLSYLSLLCRPVVAT